MSFYEQKQKIIKSFIIFFILVVLPSLVLCSYVYIKDYEIIDSLKNDTKSSQEQIDKANNLLFKKTILILFIIVLLIFYIIISYFRPYYVLSSQIRNRNENPAESPLLVDNRNIV